MPLLDTVVSLLLVEDHDELRAALRDWLLTSVHSVKLREARNLDEALACARSSNLDLVLMNLELPGANGIKATRELRRRYPGCKVVLMSLSDSEALRSAAIEAGALDLVSKRALPHALLPILGRLAA